MEGLFRGPRRARRVAQHAAHPAHTPEAPHVEDSSSPQLPPSVNPTHHTHRDLFRHFQRRRGSPSVQQGAPQLLSPEDLAAEQHPALQLGHASEGDMAGHPSDDVEAVMARTQQLIDDEEEERSYSSTEPEEETLEDQGDDLIDDQTDQYDGELEEQNEGDVGLPPDPSAVGLKEISNLGKFTVSSHKPGNGVEELRNDDTEAYWQSDGPQPHNLTIYFVKRVGIRDVRFYVDYSSDESYTPTKIVFKAGTSENHLITFANMELTSPKGWLQVPIEGTGGGPDGNTLACYVFQMQVLENHQNGKDTHLRGIKIYAADSELRSVDTGAHPMADMVDMIENQAARKKETNPHQWGEDDTEARLHKLDRRLKAMKWDPEEGGIGEPDFARDMEIR